MGNLELDLSEEEIYRDILYEMAKAEPSMIEAQLAEESQVLETIDDKLECIKQEFEAFKE